MPAPVTLQQVLEDPRIWRARQGHARPVSPYPTGCAALDAVLPEGGWPADAVTELLLQADGQGELSLLLPLLAAQSRRSLPILWVAPPYRPYLPALVRAGLAANQVHVLEVAPRDALWALEQGLRAGCCGAVLGWLLQPIEDRALRRLQLAAEAGHTPGFLFRPNRVAAQASPAALRLWVEADAEGTRLRVLKARGGMPVQGWIRPALH